tara:strand:- start:409 stop:1122 length:714 start_codon:yes stop_codon:yes gene_type:complete
MSILQSAECRIQNIAIPLHFCETYSETQIIHGIDALCNRFTTLKRLFFTLGYPSPYERGNLKLEDKHQWCCEDCRLGMCRPLDNALARWRALRTMGVLQTLVISVVGVVRGNISSYHYVSANHPDTISSWKREVETANNEQQSRGDADEGGRGSDQVLPEHMIEEGELDSLLADNRPYDELLSEIPRPRIINGIFQMCGTALAPPPPFDSPDLRHHGKSKRKTPSLSSKAATVLYRK